MKRTFALLTGALVLGALPLEPTGFLSGTAHARGLFVSSSGNNSNPGTIASPFRTVSFGLGRLAAGDTLYIRGGTYFERPEVTVSGSAAAPIVIRSYPGEQATLDAGPAEFRTPGNSDWELVNATLGEYRSRRTFSPGHVYAYVTGIPGYENGRVGLVPYIHTRAFRATSDQYVNDSTYFYVGPGTFYDPADQRIHIRLAKTSDLRLAEARYGIVFASENADPRQYSILLHEGYSTLRVSGAHLVFHDLTVNQANKSILLTTSAHDIRFEKITVWRGDSSIQIDGGNRITITGCRIYGDSPYWVFWSDMKDAPFPADKLRGTSVDLRGGAREIEISYNHIRGCGQDLIGVNDNERDITIHHNRLENAGDDALELEGTTDVGRIVVHDNYILNCLTAVAPGQDTPSFTGPLLVYRNVIALLRNPPVNRREGINSWNGGGRFGYEYMFKHGSSSSYSTRNAHYYHNTLVLLNSPGRGLNLTPRFPDNCRIANNLAVTVNGIVNRDYRSGSGMVVDGNLYWKMNTLDSERLLSSYDTVPQFSSATGHEARGIGGTAKRGTDPRFAGLQLEVVDRSRSSWELRPGSEVPAITAFMLASGSPAFGAGIAIPPHPTLGMLPDTRSSRDIGAIPFGVSAAEYRVFPFDPAAGSDVTAPSAPAISVGRR